MGDIYAKWRPPKEVATKLRAEQRSRQRERMGEEAWAEHRADQTRKQRERRRSLTGEAREAMLQRERDRKKNGPKTSELDQWLS